MLKFNYKDNLYLNSIWAHKGHKNEPKIMSSDPSNNIFDFASNKKAKPAPPKKTESAPIAPKTSESQSPEYFSEADVEQMLARMGEMQRDLSQKTDDLKTAISSSKEEVVVFFSNPKNFTPEQWNVIQHNRTELEKQAWAIVGKDPRKVQEKKLETKSEKARLGKSLGSRHGWIPMR